MLYLSRASICVIDGWCSQRATEGHRVNELTVVPKVMGQLLRVIPDARYCAQKRTVSVNC